jgi:hypothetical protein
MTAMGNTRVLMMLSLSVRRRRRHAAAGPVRCASSLFNASSPQSLPAAKFLGRDQLFFNGPLFPQDTDVSAFELFEQERPLRT